MSDNIQNEPEPELTEGQKEYIRKTNKNLILQFKQDHEKFTIATTRFNNNTLSINKQFREKHPLIKSIYCSPGPISETIPIGSTVFVMEMNNDINKIVGIGAVNNRPIVGKYNVYIDNPNYSRYVYTGKYYIDRSEMSEEEEKIMKFFDIMCFTGNKHLKRGQGITSFPIEFIVRIFYKLNIDLIMCIRKMFSSRISN
jgi:hypothetical protein